MGSWQDAETPDISPVPEADKKNEDTEDGMDNGEQKKTFARRYMPSTDLMAKRRWTALKSAFELYVQPVVYFASSLEAQCFQYKHM